MPDHDRHQDIPDEFSETLPTEPGVYLFSGVRRINSVDVGAVGRTLTVEIVRVVRNDGKLSYIGDDFFWQPREALGVWFSIDERAGRLRDRARLLILDTAVRRMAEGLHGFTWTRASCVDWISRPYRDDESRRAAERMFDHAVATGMLKSVGDDRWVLAEPEPGSP